MGPAAAAVGPATAAPLARASRRPGRRSNRPWPVPPRYPLPQGDGNARVQLDENTLTEWFGHLDHLLPHTRVALAELTCLDDGGGGGGRNGTDG
jgi:hypothetical protein